MREGMRGQDRTRRPKSAADGSAVPGDDGAVFSIGAYIRTQRRLRDVSLEELSQRTRIPIRSLERLESGAFDGEPDGFVRGFVRTVAGGLGLDPDDTLMRMLTEPAGGAGHVFRAGLPPRAWLAIAGLVAGVALLLASARLLSTPPAQEPFEPETVLRRDPVRALAEAQAAEQAEAGQTPTDVTPGPLPEVSSGSRP